jgi:cytochrome b subunit of formate dehydrogenase
VERNRRTTRWLHAAFYSCTLLLLATGGWLLIGREGDPSILATLTNTSDVRLHVLLGWALAGLALLAAFLWRHALRRFAAETIRWGRDDLGWFAHWPRAAFTGRFRRHDGDFDPGQRIANAVLVGGLLLLLASGLGLSLLHGGPVFVWLHRLHVWATYGVTAMAAGHVLVASGVLPGYRGVWRSMHLGGRLPEDVASRLWPAWVERNRASVRPACGRHTPE